MLGPVIACYYRLMNTATCSLLANPPCSAVCVTIAQPHAYPTYIPHYHYITISHPAVTLTTNPTCCLSPRQSSPKTRSFGVPLGYFLQKFLSLTHLETDFLVFTSATLTYDPRIWSKLGGGGVPKNSYILTWRIWRCVNCPYILLTLFIIR